METCLDFTDVLIRPRPTKISSRSQVSLHEEFFFKYSQQTLRCVPMMAANMDSVGTLEVMAELSKHNMFTVLHKFIPVFEIKNNLKLLERYPDNYAFSMGMGPHEINRIRAFNNMIDFKVLCIDVANGYMEDFVKFCAEVRKEFPDKIIIAGNVVCSEMTQRLVLEGKVDIVKVGIGGGSACTTRMKTGVGIPQFSAVLDCAQKSA